MANERLKNSDLLVDEKTINDTRVIKIKPRRGPRIDSDPSRCKKCPADLRVQPDRQSDRQWGLRRHHRVKVMAAFHEKAERKS